MRRKIIIYNGVNAALVVLWFLVFILGVVKNDFIIGALYAFGVACLGYGWSSLGAMLLFKETGNDK